MPAMAAFAVVAVRLYSTFTAYCTVSVLVIGLG